MPSDDQPGWRQITFISWQAPARQPGPPRVTFWAKM
jgi:hypothetical protein